DHFSIYQNENRLRLLKIADDRDAIRPQALGRFRELLQASATSPAMLDYLDNARSVVDGPNENYARELLELHTLGVDGGYTEQDVREVARCFTGWSVERQGPERGEFRFYPQFHDDGEKQVLGVILPPGQGVADGEQVLDILAAHPSTARFIAEKLCRRLVADTPPKDLVEQVAVSFRNSAGDVRTLLRTILASEAFRQAPDAKFKRPVEYIGALVRTLELTPEHPLALPLTHQVQVMGQAPFSWEPPNGYPDTQGYWASTNGLLVRWNTAFGLGRTVLAEELGLVPEQLPPDTLVDWLSERLLRRPLAPDDRDRLIAYALTLPPAEQAPALGAMMLASAYFQLR
ncbi:MAG: DUF1800 domain-containing protein, partial [Candidatus Competibacterales bacterium]|nr:DUF1800 domain-containing protein [Candidatus Competibacterales bacterium]